MGELRIGDSGPSEPGSVSTGQPATGEDLSDAFKSALYCGGEWNGKTEEITTLPAAGVTSPADASDDSQSAGKV